MQVVAHTYLLAQLKYPQREQLRGLQPQHFAKYLDVLLGDHVYGLKAKNKDGEVVASPDFELVLSYEYQIRRNVTKQMNEGTDMATALKQAMADTVIKERYFITPNVYNQIGGSAGSPQVPVASSLGLVERFLGRKGRLQQGQEGRQRQGSKGEEGQEPARQNPRRETDLLALEQSA